MESAYYPWFVLGHLVAARFNTALDRWEVEQDKKLEGEDEKNFFFSYKQWILPLWTPLPGGHLSINQVH
jgi:hypothetical protein